MSFDKRIAKNTVMKSETLCVQGGWELKSSELQPITPPNFEHGMLFRDFDGQLLMSVHSHKSVNGRYVRIPHLFKVDLSGDKLVVD